MFRFEAADRGLGGAPVTPLIARFSPLGGECTTPVLSNQRLAGNYLMRMALSRMIQANLVLKRLFALFSAFFRGRRVRGRPPGVSARGVDVKAFPAVAEGGSRHARIPSSGVLICRRAALALPLEFHWDN